MSIPFLIFAGIYFVLFLIWVILTLFGVYHILRYASWTPIPMVVMFTYLVFCVGIIIATGWMLREVDWNQKILFTIPNVQIPDMIKSVLPSL